MIFCCCCFEFLCFGRISARLAVALSRSWIRGSKASKSHRQARRAQAAALGAQRKRQLDHSMENVQLSAASASLPRSASVSLSLCWLYHFVWLWLRLPTMVRCTSARSASEAEPCRALLRFVRRSCSALSFVSVHFTQSRSCDSVEPSEATCWTQLGSAVDSAVGSAASLTRC